LALSGVLFGFGVALIAGGVFYGLPIAVQPMKAIAATTIAGQLGPGEVAAAGLLTGALLLALAATGAIGRLAQLIPRSVTAGLQLGLGLSMGLLGLRMALDTPWLGVVAVALIAGLVPLSRWAAAPAMLALVTLVGWLAGVVQAPAGVVLGLSPPPVVLPTLDEAWRGLWLGVVPQIPLTLTNAVIVTAAIARDLYPRAVRASEHNLALSTGLGNLLLAPFGAMPMCHGAGGLQAQHRFGARTGLAPILLGVVLLAIGLVVGDASGGLLAIIPSAAVGALLLVAGMDLALSRRLFDARPVCWPAIAVAAGSTLLVNPAVGLVGGWAVEMARTHARDVLDTIRRATGR
jgi:MFS superfamily sulfate permease-like transporter